MSSVPKLKLALWCVCGLALPVLIVRMGFGLGAISNLSDAIPWGLWKGLGVIAAIALAAGGFVLTGVIHTFRLTKYHALVRPAVLTAFCGYGTAATSLLFDIGIPWRIWHPMIYWQHHSALFEVAWCVILYLNVVLVIELAPVILERWPFLEGAVRLLRKVAAPVAILGVMISVLHQSTLGTIFLLTPYTLHELWYSPLLPLFFITSAAATGIMVIVVEFIVISRLYGREVELPLLRGLGKAASILLAVYFVGRFGDAVVRGALWSAFHNTREGLLFFIEMVIGTLVPCVLLALPRSRNTSGGLLGAGLMVIFGFVIHRLTVCYMAMFEAAGRGYWPTWMEVVLTAGIFSAAALVFLFIIENFAVFTGIHENRPALHAPPQFEPLTQVWLDHPIFSPPAKYSAAFIVAAAAGLFLIPFDAVASKGAVRVPARKARGGKLLIIDGNRDGVTVTFKHQHHVDKFAGDASCVRCHHANMPKDENTDCYECHADMYLATSIFDHDLHVAADGGNASCKKCHPASMPKSKRTAKGCAECHHEKNLPLKPPGAAIKMDGDMACSYTDAMHGLCISCHKRVAKEIGRPNHGVCTTCHVTGKDALAKAPAGLAGTTSTSKWVISPAAPLVKP